MADTRLIFRDNDNLVTLAGLRDITTGGGYLNSASVVANLYDPDGALVTPSGGIVLDYVSGSEGDYEGTIQSTLSLEKAPGYTLEIDAAEAGAVGHWEIEVEVCDRHG